MIAREEMTMRTLLTMGVLLGVVAVAAAGEPDAATKVRVALALSAAPLPAPGCGKCVEIEAARPLAERTGQPVVMFVNGCDGRAKDLPAGVLAAKAASYAKDGRPAGERRIVVLTPPTKPGESFTIEGTLPADATAEKLSALITRAKPRVNWFAD